MKLYYYRLQATTGLKPPLQILFWKSSKGKGCSKILKIQKTFAKSSLLLKRYRPAV